jgi:carbonic anhydrase
MSSLDGEMAGYGFDRPYIFAQIHFHWGEDNEEGSEHTINGMHFPLEVHLVHYNSKYKSFDEAAHSGIYKFF